MNRHEYGPLVVVLLASCVPASTDAQEKTSVTFKNVATGQVHQ